MNIVLIGPPGSGKGTQGKYLSKELNLPHISVGDIFRNIANSNEEDGRLLNEYMKDGRLVPSELVNKIVKNFLLRDELKKGYILDGYPRTIDQAIALEKITNNNLKIVVFEIDDNTVVSRILGRLNCDNCGAIFNSNINNDNLCNICHNGKLIHRLDDNSEVIVKRIKVFKEETYPIIEHYNKVSSVFRINATKNVNEIKKEILNLLNKV